MAIGLLFFLLIVLVDSTVCEIINSSDWQSLERLAHPSDVSVKRMPSDDTTALEEIVIAVIVMSVVACIFIIAYFSCLCCPFCWWYKKRQALAGIVNPNRNRRVILVGDVEQRAISTIHSRVESSRGNTGSACIPPPYAMPHPDDPPPAYDDIAGIPETKQ